MPARGALPAWIRPSRDCKLVDSLVHALLYTGEARRQSRDRVESKQ